MTLGSIQLNSSFQIPLSPLKEVILGVLFLQNRFWYHNFLDISKSFKLRFKMTGISQILGTRTQSLSLGSTVGVVPEQLSLIVQ